MGYTGTSEVNSALMTKWEPELLRIAKGYRVLDRFAETNHRKVGEETYRVQRMLRAAKKTTALSESVLITPSDAKSLTANYKDIRLTEWGDVFGFSSKIKFASMIGERVYRESIANQFQRSMEADLYKALVNGGIWHRVDYDTVYEKSGYCDTGSGKTAAIDSHLTQTNDFWINGSFGITSPSGPNYDEARRVTGNVQATTTVNFGTFNHDLSTASGYHLVTPYNLTSTDKLSTAALARLAWMMRLFQADPFDGGIFRFTMHPDQEADLMTDSTWVATATYDDSTKFRDYRFTRWFGWEGLISSEISRMGTDGAWDDTGIVYPSLGFGRGSYTVLSWSTPGIDQNIFGIDWRITDRTDSQNLLGTQNWIGWYGVTARDVLRATCCLVLLTSASAAGTGGFITT